MKFFQQLFSPPLNVIGRNVLQFEYGFDIFDDAQLAEDRGLLRQVRDTELGAFVDGQMGYCLSVEMYLAAITGDQSDYHVEAGGFSCTVGAEQADDFATADFDRNIVNDCPLLVTLFQIVRGQRAFLAGTEIGFGHCSIVFKVAAHYATDSCTGKSPAHQESHLAGAFAGVDGFGLVSEFPLPYLARAHQFIFG